MAHEITTRDNVMSVRKPMWHGLGTVLDHIPSREEAEELVLPWKVIPETLYRSIPMISENGEISSTYEPVQEFVANVRSDTNDLLGVVSDTYEIVQNSVIFDILEKIEGEASGSVQYETGGSLKGGQKVWAMIRLKDPIMMNDDPYGAVIPYYLIQNDHAGGGAFRGQATMTRVVCQNTAQMADLDSEQRGTEFVFSHTKKIADRIDEAKTALAGWRDSIVGYRRMMADMQTLKMDYDQEREFIDRFIPMPMVGTATDRVMRNVEEARGVFNSILYGETLEGLPGSSYKITQASIEYLNHGRRAHSQETRFTRTFLKREHVVADAVDLAMAIAG